MSTIELRGLTKSYGAAPVLAALDLTVPDASITAVLGPSGSGKTTLLRIIAGFEGADSGTVTIGDQLADDGCRTVRPQHRGVGSVPQDAGLFPHLTVTGNIAFGVPRARRRALRGLIDLVGLAGYEKRFPYQLSGGQQQRVALARALAITPAVILLDEPFGSLDAALRETVRTEVIAVLRQTRTTTILVTHDQDEALCVADHIALLSDGGIAAHGSPRELYDHPTTPRIATAIGTANILTGQLDGAIVDSAAGRLPAASARATGAGAATRAGPCQLLLRPEQLTITMAERTGTFAATVTGTHFHGHDTLLDLTCAGAGTPQLVARVPGQAPWQAGQAVWVSARGPVHVWSGAAPE